MIPNRLSSCLKLIAEILFVERVSDAIGPNELIEISTRIAINPRHPAIDIRLYLRIGWNTSIGIVSDTTDQIVLGVVGGFVQ